MKNVWDYFEEITQVPRGSKKEEKIRDYLLRTASELRLQSKVDDIGNVLIVKEASDGRSDEGTIALQAHMDMVCEKADNVAHDFLSDPIKHHEENGWMVSEGTTLGADDGIGIALILSLISDNSLSLPRLECLFTVDEETGLTGAQNLDVRMLTATTLINLDSEEEGEFCIGCAGGRDTLIEAHFPMTPTPADAEVYELTCAGGLGGHSGQDINVGRANALQETALLVNDFLERDARADDDIRLVSFVGGNLRNAIPRSATAFLSIKKGLERRLNDLVNERDATLKEKYVNSDPEVRFFLKKITTTPTNARGLSSDATRAFFSALAHCPHGVLRMSDKMPGMVSVSTNLAAISTAETNEVKRFTVETSQRANTEHEKEWASDEVVKAFDNVNATVSKGKDYPGWEPDWNSPVVTVFKETFTRMFNRAPIVKVIHAGLECGVLKSKFPRLDMVSLGPTMQDVHSPSERLLMSSVDRTRELLVEVLKK